MITTPPSQSGAPSARRRDALPLWGWIVLVLWGLLAFADMHTPTPPGVAGRMGKASESRIDSDGLQDMIQVDLSAKTAYAMTLANPGGSAAPDRKLLLDSLSKAEDLEHETHNTISAARRVLVLRALLGKPPLAAGKKGEAPLDAFGKDLPAGLAPGDRAPLTSEAKLWEAALGPGAKPQDREKLAGQVRALPNIRWWGAAASAAVFQIAHNPAEAARWSAVARSRALKPLVGVGLIGGLRAIFLLLGVPLIVTLVVSAMQLRKNPDAAPVWRTEPPAISPGARRIGAGELAGVFLTYLLTREVISVGATGFAGLGNAHLMRFPGFAASLAPLLAAMSDQRRVGVQIVAETLVYVLCALPPVVVLFMIARRRGASLAHEIGWSMRAKGENFLYGLGGYAVGLPLMTAIALLAPHLIRHAPSPSNPVIPQIATASGWFVPVMLVLLTAVAAPILEELLFRGVLMNAIQIRLGAWPAIVISGLIFGFAHPVGVAEKLALASLGMVFGWMAQTRKSLLPSTTAHFVNNFLTTLLLLAAMAG